MLTKIWTTTLVFLAWLFFCAWLVLVCREKNVHPLRDFCRFFKKQSKVGRVLLGTFFIAMWIYASVKPGDGGGNGGGGGDGGTNNIQMVIGPGSGLQPLDSPGAVTNNHQQGLQGGILPPQGGLVGDPAPVTDQWTDFTPITSTNTTRTLDGDDFRRGFVLTRVGTDEAFTFAAPAGANVCADWRAFGAASDWIYLAFEDWAFRLGTNEVDRLRVFSFGKVDPLVRDAEGRIATNCWFAPFVASLGIVPQANWPLVAGNENAAPEDLAPSRFWHFVTPSNTLQLTWQNVLLDRLTNTPVSVQMEVWPSGRFTYRYDLSRLDVEEVTNALVGACFGGLEWATNSIPTNLTSLAFYPLLPEDAANEDRDGDGLPLLDELFAFGTDPDLWDTDFDGVSDGDEVAAGTNPRSRDSDGDGLVDGSDPDPAVQTSLADLDGDGIPDAYEDYWFGSTNLYNTATNRDETGFTLDGKILGGINPTNEVQSANVISTNSCVSWHLFDAFAIDLPTDATNLVWERTFAVNRSSAWQQFFVSAAPTNASAWRLHGAVLEWETDTGNSGSAVASPLGDSFRIPLAVEDFPSSITLRLRATGGMTVHSPTPIHLIAYSPEFRVEGGNEITGNSGAKFSVFTEGSDSQISLVIDHSLRPCNVPLGTDECDMNELENMSMMSGDFSFDGNASGGTITASRPGIYTLPDFTLNVSFQMQQLRSPRLPSPRRGGGGGTIIVLDPSAGWTCSGHGCDYDGLGYDWAGDWYYEEEYYPLDSKCLRKKWYHDWGGGWSHDNCEFWVSSGIGDGNGLVTSSSGGVYVDGVMVWTGSAEHVYDDWGCGGYDEDYLGDECDSCDDDCANGNCDSLEGASLGSLKFRIPLGAPVKGQVAGFVWFSTDGPISVSKSTFQLLEHPDADITETMSSGIRRIVCHDSRGRDLRIENIANGARVTINDTAAQTLEHTWEIVNVNGSASQVRLKKISRLNNVMSDETYTYADGDWTRFDNIAGVGTQLTTYNDFVDYGDGVKSETRTTTDAAGNILSSVTVQKSRIGECDNAVIRETYREESTGLGWKWSQADYWNDPAHSGRHGQPRLVWGNARAWKYMDYDENGHETLLVEQRGSAPIPSGSPYVVSNELYNVSTLADAFVIVRDFTPLSGDSGHQDDAARPRIETHYVVTNGVATLIGRFWARYTRLNRDGYAAIKTETWRAGAQGVSVGDAGNAYSYKITYADTGEGTPLLMRNAIAESLDENGLLTVNSYSQSGGVLTQTSHQSYLSHPLPTYEVIELNASYGTVLRDTIRLTDGDTIVSDEQSIYDSQNRLRSTTYFDGTSLTNAYSCCRLLWKRDREGRKVLRSAQTGTDHLYNAMEDVWLADVSTNGQYRVTQHFYDALGRETNTVVYVGTAPGEATVASASDGKAYTTVTTSYPYGGSDYAVSTDERGRVTIKRIDILANCTESGEAVFTNGVEVVKTKSRSYFGGGSSTRREWGGDKFTEERRFDVYDASGRRIAYVVTESSDYTTVTNSISTYDFLGRLVMVETPRAASGGSQSSATATTAYAYDGISSRILYSTYMAGDIVRTTTYLYNDCGEEVGTVLDGITNRTDITYESDASNVTWRITRELTFGASTNACTMTRERMTGLSDACRSCTETQDLSGKRTRTTTSWDVGTGLTTEISESSTAETVSTLKSNGLPTETLAESGNKYNEYDAFGRIVITGRTGLSPIASYDYAPCGDILVKRTFTNGTDTIVETYAYDMLGNRIAITDALGNTIFRICDPFSRVIAEWGATYPVRYTYDTKGRRTSLSTTRDGTTWDTTTWAYDAVTGNCMSKTYADGSTVTYTYTPDNLLLRTTYASGRWVENMYDSQRRLVGQKSSDGEQDAAMQLDEFGRTLSISNCNAQATYSHCDGINTATNELLIVDDSFIHLVRWFDWQGRLSGFATFPGTYSLNYAYASDGNLESISNDIAVVNYLYTTDRLNAGYSISLSSGTTVIRTLGLDTHRRSLVTSITTSANGLPVETFAYTYDALSRPTSRNTDTFGYNARNEMTSASISDSPAAYGYDEIGNSTNCPVNSLNQYAPSVGGSQFVASAAYDLDGSMVQCGDWSYTYDADNRLKTVSSNGVLLVTNFYDTKSRRVKKVVPSATTLFFYDDWNLVEERVAYTNGTTSTVHYYWGKDLSGTLQGAGGVGGLLYLTVDGAVYVPTYDNNGNIIRYLDATGNAAAQYIYDAFGNIRSKTGPLADFFRHRFSTKYFDAESGLYYYDYRFYSPPIMRWLNRDPMEEVGGVNLYCFVENAPSFSYDAFGQRRSNLPGIVLDGLCEDAYNFAKKFLHTAQEFRAWDRYTNHGWRGRNRDIELSGGEVKFIAESIDKVNSYVNAARSRCKKCVTFSQSTSIGGSAPAPWAGALGGVSIGVTTSCYRGDFSYEYRINDLYDFDIKGFPGFTSRDWRGELGTIGVNLSGACLQCDWQTFYHKGVYSSK